MKKQILIVRYPSNTKHEEFKLSYEATQRTAGDGYLVLPFFCDVEKVEVEIVYDPQLVTGGANA